MRNHILSAGKQNSSLLGRESLNKRRSWRLACHSFSISSLGRSLVNCQPSYASKIFLNAFLLSLSLPKTASRIFTMESPRASKRLRTQIVKGKKFAVEGNIATGKSTFIKLLQAESDEWHVVPEPVARWTNISTGDDEVPLTSSQQSGGNLLQMFYDDIGRWSYTFQSYALLSRMRLQRKDFPAELQNCKNPVQFFERSLQSDSYIFALNCYESGVMSETEWNIYQDWTSYLLQSLGELKLDGIIYLRAEPEVCYTRMQKRGRNEEKSVSLDYLKNLHEKHEAWLYRNEVKMDQTLVDVPILTLDCNEEFVDNPTRQRELMSKVSKFVGAEEYLDDSGVDSNNVSCNSDEANSDVEY